MGINLRDFVKDINDLFTLEEAEQLFIAAGYQEKDTTMEGFEDIEITGDILLSNRQNTEQLSSVRFNKHFEITVEQVTVKSENLKGMEIQGLNQIFKYTSTHMGGVA